MSSPFTEDTFLNGSIRVRQSTAGYRFSIDAVILARHIRPADKAAIVDLGTGCGIIPLILACRYHRITITGVEIQPQLAELARENVRLNRLSDRVTILNQNLRDYARTAPAGHVDQVVCNPPFRQSASGRINSDREKAVARHEIEATLVDIIDAAARLLRVAGEFTAVYPAGRLADMITTMRQGGLEPKQLRLIHSRATDAAKLILITGRKNGRPGLTVSPPLILYQADGIYTTEAENMFQP